LPVTAKEKLEMKRLASRQATKAKQLAVKAELDSQALATTLDKELAQQVAFLEAFSITASVGKAAEAAGIGAVKHYDWLVTNPDYAQLFAQAHEQVADLLEAEAFRRAHDGWLEVVWYKGEPVGTVRKYDSLLLMFMLKGLRPERFRERFDVQNTKEDVRRLAKLLGMGEESVVRMMKAPAINIKPESSESSEPKGGQP
jgi:hypothetical protein